MYFYLKQPKSNKPTPIIIQYYVKKEKKLFVKPANISIHPKDWSKLNRLPKLKRGGDSYKNKRIADSLLS